MYRRDWILPRVPARLDPTAADRNVKSIFLNGTRLTPILPAEKDWLNGTIKKEYSSIELDRYHFELLQSDKKDEIVTGVLSVVFWGFSSGADGKFREDRALARANQLLEGHKKSNTPMSPSEIAQHVLQSRKLLTEENIGEALLTMMKIPFLGMSFASKVLMFMAPERVCVYDKIIADRLKKDISVDRSLVTNPAGKSRLIDKASAYRAWCQYCLKKSIELNKIGSEWSDWDGQKHSWRSVDIERAIFAMTIKS